MFKMREEYDEVSSGKTLKASLIIGDEKLQGTSATCSIFLSTTI